MVMNIYANLFSAENNRPRPRLMCVDRFSTSSAKLALAMHNNNFLLSLSRQNRFYAIGSVYGITTMSASDGQIKSAVWSKFIETV